MAAKFKEPEKQKQTEDAKSKMLDECQDNFQKSERYIQPLKDNDWDDKEALLLGKSEDSISKASKSEINDPRLSTIVFERAARVMARPATGHAYAESQDDIGKNLFMNLLLQHFERKDNTQFSNLLKMRLMNLYSHVYGSNFGIVPWSVNTKTGMMGPAFNVLRMRDSFPQPGVHLQEADYFDHRTWVGIEWLKKQDAQFWDMEEINALANELKTEKSTGDTRSTGNSNDKSYVENKRFPNVDEGSVKFPQVEIITEYNRDKWITWTPQRSKDSKPHILRCVSNYIKDTLPIVVKHSFPLLDSPIGLGEYERGQSLQKGMNGLINLYFDGSKMMVRPPIGINPNNVVPSSIKYRPGERWYMNNPGVDVVPLNLNPSGLATFQSTYDFLLSALNGQAGTTSVSGDSGSSNLGKTPEAVRYVADRESARDEWDRFMQEDLIQQVYDRWTPLIVKNLDVETELQLFGTEAKQIHSRYPDIEDLLKAQVSKSGERLSVRGDSKTLGGKDQKYTWVIQPGSTSKLSQDADGEAVTDVLKTVIENDEKLEASLNKKGKTIDIGELFSQWLEARKLRRVDKIIVDMAPTAGPTGALGVAGVGADGQPIVPGQAQGVQPTPEQLAQAVQATQQPAQPTEVIPPAQPMAPAQPQAAPAAPVESAPLPEFKDPQISQIVQEMLGGLNGIPPTPTA